MARWKLTASHYLNVPGETWEYVENDRKTGRPKRTSFPVPRLLDIGDPTCWNNVVAFDNHNKPEVGEIIVTNKASKEFPHDIVFLGDPTPDMAPVDDEAQAISDTFIQAGKWKHPIEGMEASFGDHLIVGFQAELAKAQAANARPQVEGMSELLAAMTAMMKQNQEMLTAIVAKPQGATSPALRRA